MRSAFAQGKKGALFDIDGTLADSVGAIVAGLGDAFEFFTGARPAPQTIRELIGMPLSEQMNLFGLGERDPGGLGERVQFAVQRFEAHRAEVRLFGPAVGAMRHLREAGLRIALVTSKNAQETEIYLQSFPELREACAVVCSSDVSQPKPHPDSALTACRRLGVDPGDAMLIGDSVYDLRCGRAAGCACLMVAYGAASYEALALEEPDALLRTPEDLLEWARNEFHKTPCHAGKPP
jgi:pyrophosphatase PpaX